MAYPVEVGKVYDFTVYPSTIIPGDYTNVTILSILNARTARSLADIDALHAAVYPFLPQGTVDDAGSYYYLQVQLSNGETTVLGITWIDQNTIEERSETKIYALIEGASSSDLDRVRECLVMNGFTSITLSLNPIT